MNVSLSSGIRKKINPTSFTTPLWKEKQTKCSSNNIKTATFSKTLSLQKVHPFQVSALEHCRSLDHIVITNL